MYLLDAVRYGRHPTPRAVSELELMRLYHCGPWDLARVDLVQAARHLFTARMLDDMRSL